MERLNAERWQRIEQLVDGALDLPIETRESWLRGQCREDDALILEVLALLAAGERPDAFLNEPLATFGARLESAALAHAAPALDHPTPDRIGPFRIVRELGRGGMGTVYVAERVEHFQQRVALKVIRRGLHLDEHLVRRFVEERQMLASLEHANIARLLDGGVTDDDVPWFAMELVEGERIDRWCDTRRLSIEARLELFCTVCAAVDSAHRQNIVHRDLKPSNILVRADGTVKLLDFGIARLIAPDAATETGVTRTGVRLLTPEYASPEQIRGETVSAGSDVYSLGVLLYELLTGRRPHRATGDPSGPLEQAVLTQEPPRPSAVVKRADDATGTPTAEPTAEPTTAAQCARARGTTPVRLSERLRGDLDAIVLKALARQPKQRFASAADLAAHIQNDLDGRPFILPRRARRYAVAIIAVLALSALAAGEWNRRRTSARPAASDEVIIAVGHIADYRGDTGTELARPLADLLATNLARVPSLRTVSMARLYEVMTQMGATEAANAGAYSAAARQAGASMLVDGSLYDVEPNGLRLDLRRIDVATGDVIAAYTINAVDLFALVDSGTSRLSLDVGLAAPRGSIADVTTHSEIAYRFYEEGLRAYYRGDQQVARRLLQASLAEDSTLAMAAFYLARGYPMGDINLRWIQHALRMAARASDRERLIIRTAWLLWTSDPAAVATADTLSVRYPQELDGHFFAAQALSEAGDYDGALRRLRRVVAMDSLALAGAGPRCTACDARNQIIDLYLTMDSTAAAAREARLWTELDPGRATPWLRLAHATVLVGQLDAARVAFRRAAAIDPLLNGQPQFLAVSLLEAGDYETLDRELRETLQSGSPDRQIDALWFLTLSLRYQGRFVEALEAARAYRAASTRSNPGLPPLAAARHQAQVLFELRRYRESALLFDSIARAQVGNSPSHRARQRTWDLSLAANAVAAARDTIGFVQRIDTVRTLGPRSLLVRDARLHHHLQGLLHLARGDREAAITEFRLALYAPAAYTRINYDLARTLLELGRAREAVAVLQPAVRTHLESANLYATRPELRDLLARAWDTAGVPDSALVHYRAALHAWQRADPVLHERIDADRKRVAELSRSGS